MRARPRPGRLLLIGCATAVLALAPHASHGQAPAFRVSDPDPRGDTLGSGATAFTVVGDAAFFAAETPTTGEEPWRTDGSGAGTALVRDVRPGSEGSDPSSFVALGLTAFFYADDGVHGRELWKSDGTAGGTTLVADVRAGEDGSIERFADAPVVWGDRVYFLADDGTHGVQIWRSDGTGAGTEIVTTLPAGTQAAAPAELTVFAGALYFIAFQQATGRELHRTDGTPAGTELVADVFLGPGSSGIAQLFPLGAQLFFSADDGLGAGVELWKSDGAGTQRVRDIVPGPTSSFPTGFGGYGSLLLFHGGGESSGQLWRSDGTEAGTVLVADLAQNPTPFRGLGGFTTANGLSFFWFNEYAVRPVLYRTDGTEAGTVPLAASLSGSALVALGDTVWFGGLDEASGEEPWSSDGTVPGTTRIADLRPGIDGSSPRSPVVLNGEVLFAADDGAHGFEPWTSDGTPGGTALLADVFRPHVDRMPLPAPRQLVALGGLVVFEAEDAAGREPWRSDGTDPGTLRLADVEPGPASAGIYSLTAAGSLVFFSHGFGSGDEALWRTDGTAGGTFAVLENAPSLGTLGGTGRGAVGATYFFGAGGSQLWKSDGTAAGTVLVKDFAAGASGPFGFLPTADPLLFLVDDGATGVDPWRSDGSAAGTTRIADLSGTASLLARGGERFFVVARDNAGDSLYVLAEDLTGAALLASFVSIDLLHVGTGDRLFFLAQDGAGNDGLWTSDGTAHGTVRIADLAAGYDGAAVSALVVASGGMAFLVVDDPATGPELWRSDGTPDGTGPILDVRPGPLGSEPRSLRDVSGTLVFSADDGTGRELWASDGSAAGTRQVADVAIPGGSDPEEFTAAGDLVFFVATDDEAGRALWAVPRGAVTDADADGLELLAERALGSDPNDPDSDDDDLPDGAEATTGTSPTDTDSDDDGLGDGAEVATHGTDPLDDDSDSDGLGDGVELEETGGDPLDPDGDDDGFADGVERAAGSDPGSAGSTPVVGSVLDARFFDFEEGMQGWEPWTAIRIATTSLGGAYAVEGASGAGMGAVLDLTGANSLLVLLQRTDAPDGAALDALRVHLTPLDTGGEPLGPGAALPPGESLFASIPGSAPNPDRRRFVLDGESGPHLVSLLWGRPACAPEAPRPCLGDPLTALADELRLVPEPETAAGALAAASALAALARRRRQPFLRLP